MRKNKSLMIISSVMIAVISILLIYVILISTGVIVAKKHTIRIEAIDASKEYDGTPLTLSDYRIVEGNEILDKRHHEVVVSFAGSQIDAGSSQGDVLVSVFDSNGADVTKKYNIELVGGTITVTPRLIKLRSQSISKEYDGTPLTYESITGSAYEKISERPVAGQTINYIVSGELTEIGSTYLEISMEITDQNNMPVNPNNYQIIYESEEEHGKITITPRYITVRTYDMMVNYDGQDHGASAVTWDSNDSSIRSGDRVVYVHPTTNAVDAGEYLINEFDINVVNSRGEDVSKYYAADPQSQFGTLVIKPIDLTFSTNTMRKVYDGIALDPNEGENYQVYNWIQAPSTDHYEIEFANKITEAGEIDNEATITIRNNRDEDVTKNYNITTEFGKLIVAKRQITIKTFSASQQFNGETIYGKEVLGPNGTNYEVSVGSIASSQELKLELNSKITNGGEVNNEVSKIYILDENRNDVTDNYEITKDEGKLEITKVMLTIYTASATWDYDGEPHSQEVANVEGLSNDCRIEYHGYPVLTNATYSQTTGTVVPVKNSVSYTIYDKNNNIIYDKDRGFTSNFVIVGEYWGELIVNPLEMEITTYDKTKDYDAQVCSNHQYDIGGLVNGHRISISWPNDISEVQRNANGEVVSVDNIPDFTIYDAKGRDITDNYRVSGHYGKLRINPLNVLVSTNPVVKTYDGTPIQVTSNDYSIDTVLPFGHHISNVYTIDNYTDVIMKNGSVDGLDNEISFEIIDANGQIVTHNYERIYVKKGKLQVNPIYVTLNTASADIVYDGQFHTFDQDYSLDATEEFLANIGYHISGFKSFKEVNEIGHSNECDISFYLYSDPEASMGYNIQVQKNFGKIAIRKLTINVTTASDEKVYDGLPLSNNNVTINDNDLSILNQYGITYSVGEGKTITDVYRVGKLVSSIENDIPLTFYKDGIDISKNIAVVYTKGKLRINPIPITIQTNGTKDKESKILFKTYDGTELSDTDIYIAPAYQTILDQFGATWEIDETTAIRNVQKTGKQVKAVDNKVTIKVLINNVDKTDNFDITYDTGYLRIDPIEITGYSEETHLLDNMTLIHEYDNTQVSAGTLYLEAADKTRLTNLGITYEVIEFTRATNVTWSGTNANKNALPVANNLTVKFYHGNEDVTENITLNPNFGRILVKPIEITIYTAKTRVADGNTLSKPYDGEPLVDNEVYLIDSHRAKLASINAEVELLSFASLTKVGKIDNKIDCQIVDKTTGYNYTDNIKITYSTGQLEVKGIKVTVKSYDGEHVYDGQPYSNPELTYTVNSELPDNYSIELIPGEAPSFTDVLYVGGKVSSYTNAIPYTLVVKKDGVQTNIDVDVTESYGKITINPASILINLAGDKKKFDGTPLTQTDWTFFVAGQEELLASRGHTLNITVTGTITKVGSVENSFTYSVTDSLDNDITANYNVINKASDSKLVIGAYEVVSMSSSKSKIYDGEELISHELLSEPILPEGFSYSVSYSGTQTEIGRSENQYVITILDAQGDPLDASFNGCFTFDYTNGTLEILPYITGTGNLTKQTAEADENITSLTINSDKSGVIYLKDRVYGDYVKTGWDYATSYNNDDYLINGSMILSKALEDNNYDTIGNITVDIDSNMPYLISYYSTDLYEDVSTLDDTHISVTHGDAPYSIEYYQYYYNLANLELVDSDYIAFEAAYREYVYNEYLKIDAKKKSEMINLGKTFGINISDEKLVYKIAEAVRNNYNYGTSDGRKNADDIVSYFMKVRTGTCQDFASLATLMYRAYGIPARFVTGFAVIVANENVGQVVEVKQTDAHAWVEVYIDGMGWVNVEVTAGMPANISDGGATNSEQKGSHASGDAPKEGQVPPNEEIFKVNSEKAGVFYLRGESFGNYNGNGFDKVDELDRYTDTVNPLNYPSTTLSVHNDFAMTIDMTDGNYATYLIPYYTIDDLSEFDDVYIDGNYGVKYTVNFIPNSINPKNYSKLTGALAAKEATYYSYVTSKYLSLDGVSDDLLALFEEIKTTEGFDKDDPNIISDVASYIQHAATYKFEYVIPNDCTDVVYYFLTEGKEGVCVHFSYAATLLYRYLGIPARYTVGVKFSVNQNQVNEYVSVKDSSGHAWVEVYLQGLGWVPVEVTGFKDSQDGAGNGANKTSNSIKTKIYPKTAYVKYQEGMSEVELTDIYLAKALVDQGYRVEGTISIDGDSTELGIHATHVTSYKIYDSFDNDVTGLFDVELESRFLQVYYDQISIRTMSATKEYDGTPLTCEAIEAIDASKIKDGHTFNEGNIVFTNPGQTDIGISTNNITYTNLITDEYGHDVTNNYRIYTATGTITVNPRTLVVQAESLEIDYDDFLDNGEDPYYWPYYSIVSGSLLPGHEIVDIEMDEESYLSIEEDAWFAENIINSIVIEDAYGEDVTNKYDIECLDGELLIN